MSTAAHADHGGHEDHGLHVSSIRFNAIILGALLGLTLLTYLTASMDLGFLDTPVALVIAFTKTSLVILYFMHVRWASGYVKILAATGFAFLLFLFGFTVADIATRTQEYPWGDYTWPGAAHRTGMQGDLPAPPESVEGIIVPEVQSGVPGEAGRGHDGANPPDEGPAGGAGHGHAVPDHAGGHRSDDHVH